ncbi:MAG: hypothetical protein K0S67_540 [Nitrososphaeraceae archaeon]|jgi:hypothetical protein|nr:hypothetical protein [Nitrososphaeraceae archaeon]MCD6036656.1 hypothetical protein [Nitrososphaeraceae archaeon]MDF2770037.1 hypothetical protein [Nitrososphaeraceae archaeon]
MENDGEQNKDDNNAIKYLEFNKDKILDLAEKHYENLLEALTDNVKDTAITDSYSNPTLGLPRSHY